MQIVNSVNSILTNNYFLLFSLSFLITLYCLAFALAREIIKYNELSIIVGDRISGGYMGKILEIDLTRGETIIEELDKNFTRKFLDKRGFSVKISSDRSNIKVDPLFSENVLIFTEKFLNAEAKEVEREEDRSPKR